MSVIKSSDADTVTQQGWSERDALMDEDIERIGAENTLSSPGRTPPPVEEDMDMDPDTDDEAEIEASGDEQHHRVPTVMPRWRYAGACNVETVKDGKPVLTNCRIPSDNHHSQLSWTSGRVCCIRL